MKAGRCHVNSGFAAAALLGAVLFGCAGKAERFGRPLVSAGLEERLGHGLGPGSAPGETLVPDGVSLDDGISEDEAVAIALWNSAAFDEALSELGLRRADLIQAGLLTNPVFSILFPIGSKQLEFALKLPLEVLWLRSKRVAAAEFDCERSAALLVEGGLDVARDVRIAVALLERTRKTAAFASESAQLRAEVAGVEEARLRAGDTSELESSLSRVTALEARRDAERLSGDAKLAEERLRSLLRIGGGDIEIDSRPAARILEPVAADAGSLVKDALAARPELRAAELTIEAAGERAGLARWEFLAIAGILDANGSGKNFEPGPGLELTVPVFHWNQGGRARANAELDRAARHYIMVRERISLEVRESHAKCLQSAAALEASRAEILPALEDAVRKAEKAELAGDGSWRAVLESQARLVEARSQAAVLEAGLRQAHAELERSLGRRLDVSAISPSEPPKHATVMRREN